MEKVNQSLTISLYANINTFNTIKMYRKQCKIKIESYYCWQRSMQLTLDISAETSQWSSALAQGEERYWQVCASVCVTCRMEERYVESEQHVGYLQHTRCGLSSGLALPGDVCYTNQWPATPFSFSHAGAADNLDAAYVNQDVSNGQRLN